MVMEKLFKTNIPNSTGTAINPSHDANNMFRTIPKLKVPQKLTAAQSMEQQCSKGFLLIPVRSKNEA
jgi:hypothetical protein